MGKIKKKSEKIFAPKGILKELKNVKWPCFKELMANSSLVILFTVLFGAYFFVCELLCGGFVQTLVNL